MPLDIQFDCQRTLYQILRTVHFRGECGARGGSPQATPSDPSAMLTVKQTCKGPLRTCSTDSRFFVCLGGLTHSLLQRCAHMKTYIQPCVYLSEKWSHSAVEVCISADAVIELPYSRIATIRVDLFRDRTSCVWCCGCDVNKLRTFDDDYL